MCNHLLLSECSFTMQQGRAVALHGQFKSKRCQRLVDVVNEHKERSNQTRHAGHEKRGDRPGRFNLPERGQEQC